MRSVQITPARSIGPQHDVFFIAEAGVNHNGKLNQALRLIDAAVAAGADAVKFQTFRVDKLLTRTAPKASYQARTTDKGETQHEMLSRLQLSEEDHAKLFAHCRDSGILFLSTPFEEESADYLTNLGVSALKIPSGEVTNIPFLEHIAGKGLPIILSTGMSTLAEVDTAVTAIREAGNEALVLLHCLSSYPANPAEANLRAMETMRRAFGVPVGYSDHTLGKAVAIAAVALGATVIEKHFTLDRALPGPDHSASLEPDELRQLVADIRSVQAALGDGHKRQQPSERNTAAVARKSIVAARSIAAGERIVCDALTVKRPGTGWPAALLAQVIGRTAARAIAADHVIGPDDLL